MFLAAQHELLLQIIERPDDDALRFVLADRLSESGDPLGELIHVQCTLERMSNGLASGDWLALRRRELELVRQHGAAWQQAAAPFARRLRMRRGLPHTLRCSANALLEDGGLTVLAPIERLELEQVDAEHLEPLLALPLLRRIRTLSMPDLRGLGRLQRAPPPIPANLKHLRLAVDGARALDRLLTFGLLEHVEELELGVRLLVPQRLYDLEPPMVPHLKRLAFFGVTGRYDRRLDDAWLPHLGALLALRPGLVIAWRGIEYDATNLHTASNALEPQFPEDPIARPAAEYNREEFGPIANAPPLTRRSPTTVEVMRLENGALVACTVLRPGVADAMQSLSLDAALQLQLKPTPGVLTAMSFALEWSSLYLRYEPWPSLTLRELGLPLPAPVAVALVSQLAPAMVSLREQLRGLGVAGWPRALTVDDVLVGTDGKVKLLPPFLHCLMDDGHGDHGRNDALLGEQLDSDLEGTDDGVLTLLGAAFMHLLAGDPVENPRVRPSAFDPEWKRLDALVEGCLSSRRALRFPSVEAFIEAVNQVSEKASEEAVARLVVSKQISPT